MAALSLAACSSSAPPAAQATGAGGAVSSPATTAAPTGNPSSSAHLTPDPNGQPSRCLLGGKPVNIQFYGLDANAMCSAYEPVMAALGLGNLRIQLSTYGTEVPPGQVDGCLVGYPKLSANSFAAVNTYDGGSIGSGPLAKKVCASLIAHGWAPGL